MNFGIKCKVFFTKSTCQKCLLTLDLTRRSKAIDSSVTSTVHIPKEYT